MKCSHNWIARAFGGVGYIEEKVCGNCGVVAKRVPPVIKNGQVVKDATFREIAQETTVAANRISSLINRAECARKLIQQAQDTRFYWKQFKPRVSKATLDKLEADVSASIRSIVEKLPSKGRTI